MEIHWKERCDVIFSVSGHYREMHVNDLGNITSKTVENVQAWAPGCGNYLIETKASEKNQSGACHIPFTT